jgi:hypothetical protein
MFVNVTDYFTNLSGSSGAAAAAAGAGGGLSSAEQGEAAREKN